MALGLEQVQVQFQPILDAFSSGKISLEQMRQQVEWDRRWSWPFPNYEPVFQAARDCGVSLVALNVDSEDLVRVEQGGFPGLGRERLKRYIVDGDGFADFAASRPFATYVDYVIRPSYQLHESMGLLRYTMSGELLEQPMSFRNFFSARILWDESMACQAEQWTQQNPGGLLIGLVGADHVKFQNGIPGRFKRMAKGVACHSVLLNPTLIDTRESGSVASVPGADSAQYPDRLTLQLRYLKDGVDSSLPVAREAQATGGVLPLADYLVIG